MFHSEGDEVSLDLGLGHCFPSFDGSNADDSDALLDVFEDEVVVGGKSALMGWGGRSYFCVSVVLEGVPDGLKGIKFVVDGGIAGVCPDGNASVERGSLSKGEN